MMRECQSWLLIFGASSRLEVRDLARSCFLGHQLHAGARDRLGT